MGALIKVGQRSMLPDAGPAGLELHREVRENVALVQLPSGKVSVVHIKKMSFI